MIPRPQAPVVIIGAGPVGLCLALYLAHIYQSTHQGAADNKLPTIAAPAAPATTPPAPASQPATNTPVEPKNP